MILMNIEKKISLIILTAIITGCSLSPGMHVDTKKSWFDQKQYVFIKSIDQTLEIKPINSPFGAK